MRKDHSLVDSPSKGVNTGKGRDLDDAWSAESGWGGVPDMPNFVVGVGEVWARSERKARRD